ncbi:hypothetical protein DBR39_05345 [Chryseobacterium sp. KBW03]|nr:hypothetical protein DBR39_05345 [Chryseobacterium sp. KBW03]
MDFVHLPLQSTCLPENSFKAKNLKYKYLSYILVVSTYLHIIFSLLLYYILLKKFFIDKYD